MTSNKKGTLSGRGYGRPKSKKRRPKMKKYYRGGEVK